MERGGRGGARKAHDGAAYHARNRSVFGFSSSELVLVALIVGLVLGAGRAGAWGEAIGRRWARGRPLGVLPGPGAPPAGPLPPSNGA